MQSRQDPAARQVLAAPLALQAALPAPRVRAVLRAHLARLEARLALAARRALAALLAPATPMVQRTPRLPPKRSDGQAKKNWRHVKVMKI